MSDDVAARFGANLSRLRRRAGLAQDDLGRRLGVNRTRISQLERGHRRVRIDTLARLSATLEATADELLEGITWTPARFREGGR